MYDLNFYIKNPYKDVIFDIVKTNAIELVENVQNSGNVGVRLKKNILPLTTERLLKRHFDHYGQGELEFEFGYLYSLYDAIKYGPKVICPSFQDCLALQNTKIHIPYNDYKQPYPTVMIELPLEYQKHFTLKTNRPSPKSVIVHHNNKINFGFMSLIYKCEEFFNLNCFIHLKNKNKTIEEIIADTTIKDDADVQFMKEIERIVMNINLVMICKGLKSKGFINHKHKIHTARQKPNDLEILDFAQQIYRKENYKYNDPTPIGSHDSPKPHWRSGHMRNQHYGKNNSQTKLIFIEPVFVLRNKFEGSLEQTSVEYRNLGVTE